MRVYTIEQMQALERASDAAGHSYEAMMAAAGAALARAVDTFVARTGAVRGPVLILAGPGNNGGDGLVAGRELARMGFPVVLYLWKRDDDDSLVAAARAEPGVDILRWEEDGDGQKLRGELTRARIIIDALFGTGLSRGIAGAPAAMLAEVRKALARPEPERLVWPGTLAAHAREERPVLVAADIPSGLHGDNGTVDRATVPADLTVTFAGPKQGMLTAGGADVVGELVVADIGIPAPILSDAESRAELLTPQLAAGLLPERSRSGHKGTFGTTMVIGGSMNYVGAPALSALAAGRSGAGMVTLAVPAAIHPLLAARAELTTATCVLLPHDMGALRPAALEVLLETLTRVDALVLGPGLGSEEATHRFVWALLDIDEHEGQSRSLGFLPATREKGRTKASVPLPVTVIDADGLNALAAWDGEWWEHVSTDLIMTPHPGEMGRLLGREVAAIQEDRLATAAEAARRFGQVVVLKGAHTVVAAPDGRLSISPSANDALAKAGSGDVLSGIIGALLGQGLAPFDAARAAVVAHGLAGERVRERYGGHGAIAGDLVDVLPAVWQYLASLR